MEQRDSPLSKRKVIRSSSLPAADGPVLVSAMSPTASSVLQYRSSASNAFSPHKLGARPRSATPGKQVSSPSNANAASDSLQFVLQANQSSSIVARRPDTVRQAQPHILHLDRCNLSACCLLEGEQQLRVLTYQHNNIRRISNVSQLGNLVCLDLYSNALDSISGLDDLPSLRVLILGKNYIPKITNLTHLAKLDVLDLHQNLVEDMAGLQTLTSLRVLNLSGNRVRSLANLKPLTRLTELNLSRNFLNTLSLPQQVTGTSSCTSSGSLNQTSSPPYDHMAGKQGLTTGISFGESYVPSAGGSPGMIWLDTFALPSGIVSLQLSHNRLSSLSELTHMTTLTALQDVSLTGNPVTKIHPPQIWRLLVLLHCAASLTTMDSQQVGSTERQILGDSNTLSTLNHIMQQYGVPKISSNMQPGRLHSPRPRSPSYHRSPNSAAHLNNPCQPNHRYHPSNGGWIHPAEAAMTSILAKMQAAGLNNNPNPNSDPSGTARPSTAAPSSTQSEYERKVHSMDHMARNGRQVGGQLMYGSQEGPKVENRDGGKGVTNEQMAAHHDACSTLGSTTQAALTQNRRSADGVAGYRSVASNIQSLDGSATAGNTGTAGITTHTGSTGSTGSTGITGNTGSTGSTDLDQQTRQTAAATTPRRNRPRPRSAPRRLSLTPFQASLQNPKPTSNNSTPRSQQSAANGSRYNPCLQLQANAKGRAGQQTTKAQPYMSPRYSTSPTHESYLTPLGLTLTTAQQAAAGMRPCGREDGQQVGNCAGHPLHRSQSDGLSAEVRAKLAPQPDGVDRQRPIPIAWKPQEGDTGPSAAQSDRPGIRLSRPDHGQGHSTGSVREQGNTGAGCLANGLDEKMSTADGHNQSISDTQNAMQWSSQPSHPTCTAQQDSRPNLSLFLPGTSMLVTPLHLQIWGNAMHALLDPAVQSIQHLSLIHVHITLIHQQLETVCVLPQLVSLTLQHNALDTPGLLQPLSRLTSLREVDVVDNLVAQVPHFQLYMLSLIPSLRIINQEAVPQSSIDLVVHTLRIGSKAISSHQDAVGRQCMADIHASWRECTISDASSSDEQVEEEDEEDDAADQELKMFVDDFLTEAAEGAQKYLDRLLQFEQLWPKLVKAYIVEGYNGTF